MHAIPTTYGGVNFRSRLEARWAAFFDLAGWPWDYEPVDLEGYIPDFIVRVTKSGVLLRPSLVEVKPAITFDDSVLLSAEGKILATSWEGPYLILGVGLIKDRGWKRRRCFSEPPMARGR